MAITTSDIAFYLSTTSGSAGDTLTSTPGASLGKYCSQTVYSAGANTLFDDVSGTENAASDVEYRCVFIRNNHATLTATSVVVFVSAEVAGGTSVAIAIDNIAASDADAAGAQAAQIANEDTAPTGVGSFSTPTTDGTGLSIGSLAPDEVRAIWIRRTAANTAAAADGFTLAYALDTAA